jgi:hypothetical protein
LAEAHGFEVAAPPELSGLASSIFGLGKALGAGEVWELLTRFPAIYSTNKMQRTKDVLDHLL